MTNSCCFNIDRGMVNRGTVDYKILLKKLEFSGFEGRTLSWFHLYLANRQQVCFANGVTSTAKTITCGVPQGSITKGIAGLFAEDTNLIFSSCKIK